MSFKVLSNFPAELRHRFNTLWYDEALPGSNKVSKIDFDPWPVVAYQFADSHMIYPYVEQFVSVRPTLVEFLVNDSMSGLMTPHKDHVRNCCINGPIEVDLDDSKLFVIKDGLEATPIPNQSLKFEYKHELFDFYSMEDPVLLDTTVVHGSFNYSMKKRILFSITFDSTYSSMINTIPNGWYNS